MQDPASRHRSGRSKAPGTVRELASGLRAEWRDVGGLGRVAILGLGATAVLTVAMGFTITAVARSDLLGARADLIVADVTALPPLNEGAIAHEFRLSNAHRVEEHLASGHEGHDESGGHHGDADVVQQLEPGDEGEVTVTFPEDVSFFTEIACLIPGHYEAGMKAISPTSDRAGALGRPAGSLVHRCTR
jgi:uncharacterized cupredoxin-like copper-binding protein